MPASPAWPPKSMPRRFVAGPLGPGISVELDVGPTNEPPRAVASAFHPFRTLDFAVLQLPDHATEPAAHSHRCDLQSPLRRRVSGRPRIVGAVFVTLGARHREHCEHSNRGLGPLVAIPAVREPGFLVYSG